EIVRAGALTGDTELSLIGRGRRRNHNPRRQLQERVEAAAIEREIFNQLAIDDGAHRRRLSVYQRRSACDGDRVGKSTDRESEVNRKRILNAERNIRLDERLESYFGNLQAIGPGRQVGQHIDALGI